MLLDKCVSCKVRLAPSEYLATRTVAGVEFELAVPSMVCPECGKEYVGDQAYEAFERHVAGQLALHGPPTGEAFRYMRKVIGLSAVEAAELLGLSPGTVSRWENGHRDAEPVMVVLLGTIVLEYLKGERTTADRLLAQCA